MLSTNALAVEIPERFKNYREKATYKTERPVMYEGRHHDMKNKFKILGLAGLIVAFTITNAQSLMPNFKKGNDIFGVYQWNNICHDYRERIIQGVTHNYRNTKTFKWNYSVSYLVCNRELAELPFSVYNIEHKILFIDNLTDNHIDKTILNPRRAVYQDAPECE